MGGSVTFRQTIWARIVFRDACPIMVQIEKTSAIATSDSSPYLYSFLSKLFYHRNLHWISRLHSKHSTLAQNHWIGLSFCFPLMTCTVPRSDASTKHRLWSPEFRLPRFSPFDKCDTNRWPQWEKTNPKDHNNNNFVLKILSYENVQEEGKPDDWKERSHKP